MPRSRYVDVVVGMSLVCCVRGRGNGPVMAGAEALRIEERVWLSRAMESRPRSAASCVCLASGLCELIPAALNAAFFEMEKLNSAVLEPSVPGA